MSDWVLPMFPSGGVAITMTTTVWIGALIVIFFNLRFGWTLSGLVIPGYLVPLIIAKPTAASVIIAEALLTYWIVYALSEWPHYLRSWSSFFGRDRFFAIVVVSVVVRCLLDGWALPWAGQQLSDQFGISIDYRHDLHSYGLIIVSLIANYFWKPGLVRGCLPLATTIGLCYLIVQFGLTRFTNFNLGSLDFLYDDIASSLLASPKAYIVLLTTAFVASWLNLRYSWEFNGILIPALLALLWHEPAKIAISLCEAAVIFASASLLLRMPMWSRTTMEGGRKIAFFFTVCFAYRVAVAHLLPRFFPSVLTTDAFGFGYLLTTLMAMKAHDKKFTIRLIKATLHASMLGAAIASAIGFGLTWIDTSLDDILDNSATPPRIVKADGSLHELMRFDKVGMYATRQPESYRVPLYEEIAAFESGLRWLRKYASQGDTESFSSARRWLGKANFDLLQVEDRFLYLRERAPRKGWGLYVIDMASDSELMVQVPAPLNEWGTVESGFAIYRHTNAKYLAIWGTDRFTNRNGASDCLIARNTIIQSFHRILGRQSTLQVRGYNETNVRAITRSTAQSLNHAVQSSVASLRVKRSLPPGLRLDQIETLIGEFDLEWGTIAERNVLRSEMRGGFSSLFLDKQTRQRLVSNMVRMDPTTNPIESAVRHENGSLSQWLLASKPLLANRGSNAYVVSSLDELLFLDEEVLTPLIQVAAATKASSETSAEQLRVLEAAATAANVLDYELTFFRDDFRNEDYIVLIEAAPRKRHWGTFVFRFGLDKPHLVQVPRPLLERSSYEFGVSLFERPAASALFIAGANPRANTDGSSDVSRLANKTNPYNLVQQVFLREMQSREMLIIQARAIQSPVDADVVIAVHDGTTLFDNLPEQISRLVSHLEKDGLSIRFVDGAEDVAGYEIGLMLQSSTLNHTLNKQLATLWLSPTLRGRFRQQTEHNLQHAEFHAVGIESLTTSLSQYLSAMKIDRTGEDLPPPLLAAIAGYADNGDVVQLRKIVRNWPAWKLTRIADEDTGQSFVVLTQGDGRGPHVINLSSGSVPARNNRAFVSATRTDFAQFIDSRTPWAQLLPVQGVAP